MSETRDGAIALDELTAAFASAREAAIAADPGERKDGGACNLDTPIVYLKGLSESEVLAAAEAAGVRVAIEEDGGYGWFVFTPMNGMADRRTAMASAAVEAMKAAGLKAYIRFEMD